MQYISTRDLSVKYSASRAITQGLARDGGLLTPYFIPKLPGKALLDLKDMSYQNRAVYIMKLFLEEFSVKELTDFTTAAYGPEKFDTPAVAPVHTVDANTHCLELWHGPTCAFKDMALQMLPHLLSASLVKTEEPRTACILVATSGDTGKGALEGFKDVDRTRILVFYPKDGVSQVQELQMVTQEGKNVGVSAVYGNFDDAQTGVKRLFSDESLRDELDARGFFFSSANSINWGRVLPQIVYYVSAYCDLLREEKIAYGDTVNVCVPTGNFGNILAAYYAKEMGVPIGKLICASNSNNVLTDFIRTGCYDRNRTFHNTMSPSMDILISSNLERLLYSLTQDVEEVKGYMEQLAATGRYEVREKVRSGLQKLFCGYCCDDAETQKVIRRVHDAHGYLIDPHTAVAFSALEQYRVESGDQTPCIVVSTASPFKFCDSVLGALGKTEIAQGLDVLDQLSETSGLPAPAPLASLRSKKIRFTGVVEKENMVDAVLSMLEKYMALFAIGDTHLSFSTNKPMDVFGGGWSGYVDKLRQGFEAVGPEDTVVLCGDLSWGMSLEEAKEDFAFLNALPGKKLLMKGNHDYWWNTASKMRAFFKENGFDTFELLHNNCSFYGDIALCGTRGWFYEEDRGDHSAKVFNRELIRLETSLKAGGAGEKYCFLHYPPLYHGYCCQEIIDLLEQYGVTRCFYGHLHGGSHRLAVSGIQGGVEYHLVSADYLGFRPFKILD